MADPTHRYERLAMIARWKPVHLGHAAVLRGLVRAADHVTIGIGSSNRYDVRNPFTADESAQMIRAVVGSAANVELCQVPDLDDGPRWRASVRDLIGPCDAFVTANAFVRELLAPVFVIVHPVQFVPPDERIRLDATTVRVAMARGDEWRTLVPANVADFIIAHGLDARFRREFGEESLRLARDAGRA